MSATPVDLVAVRINDTVTELRPVSSRARSFILSRRSDRFSRSGLRRMIADGWIIEPVAS